MYALFFEVRPKPGHLPHYFEHVERLRPALARHTGLLFLDRYRSLSDEAVLLSHQHWRDEAAILGWRRDSLHLQSQQAGRYQHFADYRIRVASLVCPGQRACEKRAARDAKRPGFSRGARLRHARASRGPVPDLRPAPARIHLPAAPSPWLGQAKKGIVCFAAFLSAALGHFGPGVACCPWWCWCMSRCSKPSA